ncbi:MAG: flagellar biosynthetic protein FliR [Fusobacteriota bacterium]
MEFIYSEVIFFLLITMRISGIFFVSPFFSNGSIPRKIKILFVFLVVFLIFTSIEKNIDILTNLTFFDLTILVLKESLLGFVIGFIMVMFFSTVQIAAQIYSMDMGFGMVNVLDPISQFQLPILGQFKYLFLLAVFLNMGIHRRIILTLINSFEIFEVGNLDYSYNSLTQVIVTNFAYCFSIAIKIALPVLGVLFLIDVILGIMAKIAPQMNVFFIGMPLKILVGFLILISFVPVMVNYFQILLNEMYAEIIEIINIILT